LFLGPWVFGELAGDLDVTHTKMKDNVKEQNKILLTVARP